MDLNIKIIRTEIENPEHRIHFAGLFDEYISNISTNIESSVVDKLFGLPYFHGFICYVDNAPSAFAVCFESYSSYRDKRVLNIHDFMVSANYRGYGLGKALFNGIESYCVSNDYLKITLEVDEGNTAAKKLYNSCGFQDYQVCLKGLLLWQKYI